MLSLSVAVSVAGCAVRATAHTGSTEDGRYVGVGARTGAGAAGAPDTLDRSRPPEVGPPPALPVPELKRLALSNGLEVLLVEQHALPVVAIQVLVPGGAGAAAATRAGLAALTADMLDEGTASRSALAIAAELERLGSTLYSTAGYDASQVELVALRPRLEPSLDLLADVLLHPSFPDQDLARVRDERLTRVLQQRDEPRALADNAFAAVLYGPEHPWGQPLLGTAASLPALDRDDVVAFYRERYHAGNATVIVAGDVTEEALLELLEPRLGGWERRDPPGRALPATPAVERPALYLVDKPGAAQSEIRVGRVAVARTTVDYFPLTVLNTVLGGSFTSRLNAVLREEKGFTYGAGSGFAMRREPGPFVAQAAVHTPVTDSAVAVFLEEIERLREEAVPEDELTRARNYVALRLPQRFETVGDLVSRISELVVYGLPEDYWGSYVPRLLEVSAGALRSAAERHLDPRRMVVVVAGDREAIETPLRSLGLPVEVVPAPPAPVPGAQPAPGRPAPGAR